MSDGTAGDGEEIQTKGAPASPPLNDLLYCYPPIEIKKMDKYRSCHRGVNQDYDRVRVVIDLHLPEHYKLYYKLKSMVD